MHEFQGDQKKEEGGFITRGVFWFVLRFVWFFFSLGMKDV